MIDHQTSGRVPRPGRTLGTLVVGILLTCPASGRAQQAAAAPLVLDHVTVVDVEQGNLLPDQRVVVVGTRIQSVGLVSAVPIPTGAQRVDAPGKYLIPGLWDLHVHPDWETATDIIYPLLLANGVTGFRDAHTMNLIPLDTLRRWRQEILAGTRIGPPRQVLTSFHMVDADCSSGKPVKQGSIPGQRLVCLGNAAEARFLVDSVKAAGADMIKMYDLQPATYFVLAAEARRIGIPFGGHLPALGLSALTASDSGAAIIDHLIVPGGIAEACLLGTMPILDKARNTGQLEFVQNPGSVEHCRPLADKFRRNQTWFVATTVCYPNMLGMLNSEPIAERLHEFATDFWAGKVLRRDWLQGPIVSDTVGGVFAVAERVGLPIMAGTDVPGCSDDPGGFSVHGEVAMFVAEGMTPLHALQTATLNPAKFLHATDSLGTVAPGKLADLVLLDGNPLADIRNLTAIQAVIANGRYFDRAALDQLLTEARAKGMQQRKAPQQATPKP